MARTGITQAQVNDTADALLRAGERPTIERVRQALGTGSPNTLVRLLEAWWVDLGRRLDAQAAKLALPDAPETVVVAASQIWLVALDHAQALANSGLRDRVQAVDTERAALIDRESKSEATLATAMEVVHAANESKAAAEIRLADLQRLVQTVTEQCDDLQDQRDTAMAERDALTLRIAQAQDTHDSALREAISDRQVLQAQFSASEDRWLQEVDRARQEASKAQVHASLLEKRGNEAARTAGERESALRAALSERERAHIKVLATAEAQATEIERQHAQLKAVKGPATPSKRKRQADGATSPALKKPATRIRGKGKE